MKVDPTCRGGLCPQPAPVPQRRERVAVDRMVCQVGRNRPAGTGVGKAGCPAAGGTFSSVSATWARPAGNEEAGNPHAREFVSAIAVRSVHAVTIAAGMLGPAESGENSIPDPRQPSR